MRTPTWVFVSIVFAILLIAAPEVSAETTICTGALGAVTVDNLVVPDGATCTLNRTRVEGNIFVETGATLLANGVDVNGNIQANGHRAVIVWGGSFVGGSLEARQGLHAVIDRTVVIGDVHVEQNTGRISLSRNLALANMQVNQNSGGVRIVINYIAQNLQCQANEPAPTGGGNVAGDKEDQCENL